MRVRSIEILLVACALATSACADLLGVEDVAPGEGGGGAGGGPEGSSPTGVGAGLPFTASGSATADAASGAGGATTSDAATSGSASTGAGSGCGAVLPACPGAVPSAFEQEADLDLGFDRDGASDEIEVKGGQLELEPRDGDDDDDDEARYAAVKSKSPIVPTGACAVWVDLVESGSDLAAGLAVGPGTPSEDDYRIERRGVVVAAMVGGADVAQVPYVKDVTRHLRIRFEAGTVGFDVSADAACWSAVGDPVPMTAAGGLVRLHAEGSGKAKIDGYCL